MKKLIIVLSFLLPLSAAAQTNLVFDLSVNDFTPKLVTLATNSQIVFTFTHQEVLGDQNSINYHITDQTGKIYDHSSACDARPPMQVNLTTAMPGYGGDVTFTISQEVGTSLRLLTRFVVSAINNQVSYPQSQVTHAYFNRGYTKGAIVLPAVYKDYKVVIYDPCANTYKIFNRGHERDALWFRPFSTKRNGNGVLFLINDFNPLKYTITVSSTFTNRFTDVPDLFTSVLNLMGSPGAAAAAAAAPTLPDEISKIMQMNADLKTVLNLDCANFVKLKGDIQNNAMLNFGGNGMVSIDFAYNQGKAAIIAARQVGVVPPRKIWGTRIQYRVSKHVTSSCHT